MTREDEYKANRAWSDLFIPQIKRIVAPLLLVEAPKELDMKEATDLMVLEARNMRIAARVRSKGFAEKYPNQFTIRSGVPSGVETELQKIINGFGDWMFYGHSDGNKPSEKISSWHVLDLHVFRATLIRKKGWTKVERGQNSHGDGTSFVWFDIKAFPTNFIIDSSDSYFNPV